MPTKKKSISGDIASLDMIVRVKIPGLLLLLTGNTKIKLILVCCSFFIFVKSRWQQKTCYLLVCISHKKDRQTQHYFLSKPLARQFDLPSRLSVTTAKFRCRKFPFAVMLRNYGGKILPKQFLVSSEGCIMDLLIALKY